MDVTYGKPLSEIRSGFKEQDGTPTENSKEIPPPPFTLSSLFLNQPNPDLRDSIIMATSICENLCTSNQISTIQQLTHPQVRIIIDDVATVTIF